MVGSARATFRMPGRDDGSQHPFVMLEKIIEPEFAFGFFGAAFSDREQPTEATVGLRDLSGQTSRSGAVRKHQPCADDRLRGPADLAAICFTASNIRTTPAREFTSVTAIARYPVAPPAAPVHPRATSRCRNEKFVVTSSSAQRNSDGENRSSGGSGVGRTFSWGIRALRCEPAELTSTSSVESCSAAN